MQSYKRAFLALCLTVIMSSPLFADDILELVKKAPDAKAFPDANAVIEYSDRSYELKDNGKAVDNNIYLIKVFNHKGREKYSDQKVPFNKEKDELTLIKGGTYKADLTFTPLEKKAINDVTPPWLSGAEMYASFLHRVFSFPVVDPGSTLYMNIRKVTDLRDDRNISDRAYFQFDEPLIRKKIAILVPKNKTLAFRMIHFKDTLKKEDRGSSTLYTMDVRNVPQIKQEEAMPPMEEVAENMLFSTASSWDEAIAPLSSEFFKACTVTPAISKCVAELTGSCTSPRDRIEAIAIFMAQQIRTITLPLGCDGYKPHAAEKVLLNKYGDCRDKTVLMVTLLKAAGIESFPALVSEEFTPLVKDVPTMEQFDSLLVALPVEGSYRFLNPYGEFSQFGYVNTRTDAEALVVREKGCQFVPLQGFMAIENRAVNTISGVIDEKGDFKGTIAAKLTGVYDQYARDRFYSMRAAKLSMYFEQQAEQFCPAGCDLAHHVTDPLDLRRAMEVSMDVGAPALAVRQDTMMVLKIPVMPFSWTRPRYSPSLKSREYPYNLGGCSENLFTFTASLPRGYAPLYMPESTQFRLPCGIFSLTCSFDAASSELTFQKSYRFTRNRVAPSEYGEFKKALETLDLEQKNLVLIKKQ